ncbi:MAG: ArsR family transcriptional regulator [Thaumarchaeota archaeon]|nr:MAG: ArsR family transcriptional regulator [Nitrososphaerota archaeon]
MSQSDLDSILLAVENPVRRKIIRRLSEEPGYQLQLSKELGLSQQLVAKHLDSMEDAGFVSSMLETSPRGPKRKEYLLRRSVSITIDFAPSLFRTRVFSFGASPGVVEDSEGSALIARMNDVLRSPDEAARIGPLGEIISDLDRKLRQMEEERAVLLYLRNLAMTEAARASGSFRGRDRRKTLQYLLREQNDSLNRMSTTLGLREQIVGDILVEIEKELWDESEDEEN